MNTVLTPTRYVISKELCQAHIEGRGLVCDRCGRKPVPIETVDNAGSPTYWSGCLHDTESNGHFTIGVPRRVFELAKKWVCDGHTPYKHLDKQEYTNNREYWFQDQVVEACNQILRLEGLRDGKPPRKTLEEFLGDKYW